MPEPDIKICGLSAPEAVDLNVLKLLSTDPEAIVRRHAAAREAYQRDVVP